MFKKFFRKINDYDSENIKRLEAFITIIEDEIKVLFDTDPSDRYTIFARASYIAHWIEKLQNEYPFEVYIAVNTIYNKELEEIDKILKEYKQ